MRQWGDSSGSESSLLSVQHRQIPKVASNSLINLVCLRRMWRAATSSVRAGSDKCGAAARDVCLKVSFIDA